MNKQTALNTCFPGNFVWRVQDHHLPFPKTNTNKQALLMLATVVGIVFVPAKMGYSQGLVYVPNSTKRVCQLTGDFDRTTRMPTINQTKKRFGVVATDLGYSFEHKGQLYFLFGDTWGRRGAWDAVAWTNSQDPQKIRLEFHRGKDGKWIPPKVPGISQKAFEIPSGGFSLGDTMYVVFTTDHSPKKVMGRSVLCLSHDDGKNFQRLYELSRDKFINVSFWSVGGWLYICGSGEYRKSSPYLARVRPKKIQDRSSIQYFAGRNAKGKVTWSPEETDATRLFRHDVIGEFSIAYLEPVKRYVMLYGSSKPRGITMRSAKTLWGPWSKGTVVFEPRRDKGYG
ncbi:MAG: DUF4185 domain-containing protein [Gemmataceae bacterium]